MMPSRTSTTTLWRRNSRAVAGAAHLRVAFAEPLGIEPRPVRIEVPPPLHSRRVTGHAIPLGVAGDTALQALPRGRPVPEQEAALGIVVAGLQHAPG